MSRNPHAASLRHYRPTVREMWDRSKARAEYDLREALNDLGDEGMPGG